MNKFVIAFLLLLSAVPVFSEEPAGTPSGDKTSSMLQETGGELVTPRGNVYVGMPTAKLYDIFQEQDRILIPHAILSKEWHVFRDFTSKNKNDAVTFYIDADKVTGWKRSYAPAAANKGSKYEYTNSEHIDVWFFPLDKAKWDGSKLNLLEWNLLVRAQKVMFIIEYMKQFNAQYHTNINVDIDRYILGMDYFTDNCPESCISISAGEAINNLLISDGKAKEDTQ